MAALMHRKTTLCTNYKGTAGEEKGMGTGLAYLQA